MLKSKISVRVAMVITVSIWMTVSLIAFQNCGADLKAIQGAENISSQEGEISNSYVEEFYEVNDFEEVNSDFEVENSIVSSAASKSCRKSDLKFRLPLNGAQGLRWTINNFVDLAGRKNQLRDYRGKTGRNAKTYDNHAGIDFDVPNFRAMQRNYAIVAAAPGVVERIKENQFDKNTNCNRKIWNAVLIRHNNGFTSTYGHLKKNSVPVKVGQRVKAGQKIGVVGSSGCSYHPHLHFEVRDCANRVVDPMQSNMFRTKPNYNSPLRLMDLALKAGPFKSYVALQKPPLNNTKSILLAQKLGIGLYVSGSKAQDLYRVRFINPDGRPAFKHEVRLSKDFDLSLWRFDAKFGRRGLWTVQIFLNNKKVRTAKVRVR